jgi:hypothetical protein
MPWTNSHLHHFIFPDTLYSDPTFYTEEDPGLMQIRDESEAVLSKVAVTHGCFFAYLSVACVSAGCAARQMRPFSVRR